MLQGHVFVSFIPPLLFFLSVRAQTTVEYWNGNFKNRRQSVNHVLNFIFESCLHGRYYINGEIYIQTVSLPYCPMRWSSSRIYLYDNVK